MPGSQHHHSHHSPQHSHHSQACIPAGNPSFLSSGTYSQALGQIAAANAAGQGFVGGGPPNYGGFAPYAGPNPAGGYGGSYPNMPSLNGGYGGIPTGYGYGGCCPAGQFAPPPAAPLPPWAGGFSGPGSYAPPPALPLAGGFSAPGSYVPQPQGYGPPFPGPSQYAQNYIGYLGQLPYDHFSGHYEMPDAFGHMDHLHHQRNRSKGCC